VNQEHERPREECEGNVKIGLMGTSCNDGRWIKLGYDGDRFMFVCEMFRF
jgi:hypothetical protein